MEERDIFRGITSTLVEKPKYRFTIEIANPAKPKRTIWDAVRGVPVPTVETEREFVINPCKVGNMYRIAGMAAMLPDELKAGSLSEALIPVLNEHLPSIVYMVGAAIQNDQHEPAPELIRFIEDNFDNIDLFTAFNNSIDSLELQSFMNSIVLAKGTVTVLKPKTSPTDGSELIASPTAR